MPAASAAASNHVCLERNDSMRATQLLKADHTKVKKLFRQFGQTTERAVKTRQRLVDRIATELDVHVKIEEEIFYPAVERVESLPRLGRRVEGRAREGQRRSSPRSRG
jgi:hemerythrin superfamily protein